MTYHTELHEGPLTHEARSVHLSKKKRVEVSNAGNMVIRMNSTYLELVDGGHDHRGVMGSFGLFLIGLSCVMLSTLWLQLLWKIYTIPDWYIREHWDTLLAVLFGTVLFSGMFAGGFKWMRYHEEWFSFTHHPIRLNRRNQTVYVFMGKEPPLIIPWDSLYFVLDPIWGRRTLAAHILKDPATISGTVWFGYASVNENLVLQYWEFIRRYMEEGPQAVRHAKNFEFCLPIAEKRESLRQGWLQLFWYFGGGLRSYSILPLIMMDYVGRLVHRATSTIPYWPADIEAACRIDPDDKYVRDDRQNPKWFR